MTSNDSVKTAGRFLIPCADVEHPHASELVIKRSRFLTLTAHSEGLDAGRLFVEQVRGLYPDATHHCWACVGRAPGDMGHAQCSDDGEPHGTAGRPMLQILAHSGIGEVCTVVVRWFGGVKLGTGGLVRAYQDSVRENLETLSSVEKKERVGLALTLDYPHMDAVMRLVKEVQGEILATRYEARIHCELFLAREDAVLFRERVCDMTGGTCCFSSQEEVGS
ncbi:MAG: YigZ family protein [Desulfovibrio sp.]|nr:YigZ family protein [Desulfovibrio sp.]